MRVASSRRLHGVQEKLRTPRCAQLDLLERRVIAVTSPWHLHWTPWGLLGRHATARILCMHKVRAVARRCHDDLNERRGNAVGSSRTPRGRRVHAVGTHMIATRTPLLAVAFARRPHGVYGDVTATLPRPHGASTAFAQRLHRISFIPLRPHGDHTELSRRSPRSHGASTKSFGVCRAFAGRLHGADTVITVRSQVRFTKENGTQATFVNV